MQRLICQLSPNWRHSTRQYCARLAPSAAFACAKVKVALFDLSLVTRSARSFDLAPLGRCIRLLIFVSNARSLTSSGRLFVNVTRCWLIHDSRFSSWIQTKTAGKERRNTPRSRSNTTRSTSSSNDEPIPANSSQFQPIPVLLFGFSRK